MGGEKRKEGQAEPLDIEDIKPQEVEEKICVVCWVNKAGVALHPCGHDHFCESCCSRFRTCPLCRTPLSLPGAACAGAAPDGDRAPLHPQDLLTRSILAMVGAVTFFFWLFIFFGGAIEWMHDLPRGCDATGVWNATLEGSMCEECDPAGYTQPEDQRCNVCRTGYINGGWECFEHLDDLPPVQTAAALGPATYFKLIVATQVAGCVCEVALICYLRMRRMMPAKEIFVLVAALAIEVLRMLLVDIFVLQEYFGGQAYQVFRAAVPCDGALAGARLSNWTGADGRLYCDDLTPYGPATQYYIATHREAWVAASSECPTYTATSALLDYSRNTGSFIFSGGHPRYAHLGWVIGGEFAMFYLFAIFVNEVADMIFVIPSTTWMGMWCKVFSVVLELFQLGALCPAAVFVHGECLQFLEPLGISLHLIRDLIVWFGYCLWGLVFASIPLAAMGFILTANLMFISSTCFAALIWVVRVFCSAEHASQLAAFRLATEQRLIATIDSYTEGTQKFVSLFMLLSFLPLLIVGVFLGLLVIVGQASKSGTMQTLTALVLVSDVLFKVVATAAVEAMDYALHLRVRRAVWQGAGRRLHSVAIGRRL